MAELLIGVFVEESAHILTFTWREGKVENHSPAVASSAHLYGKPLAVLVDGGTASAAESCAYAFQSLGRAMVIGEVTAGAANPGAPFTIDSGFTVFISTGSPVDPRTGCNWEEVGVQPDVEMSDIDFEAVLDLPERAKK